MMIKGLFILVDGPSASGKDSIINELRKDLEKLNLNVISIEETKDKNYDRVKILKTRQKGDLKVAKTIIAERKKLYLKKVIPNFSKGKIVIANRGETTTLCYQTLKKELNMDDVWGIHRAENVPLPDLVVITTCTIEEALRRENLRKPSHEEKNKKYMSGKFTISSKKMGFENRMQIHKAYGRVKSFLENKGIKVMYLKTDKMNIPQESKSIVKFIKGNL